jgi:glucose/arabinose dehydrogenase
MRRTVGVGVGLLLLSGCEAARTSSQPTSGQTKKPQPAPRPRAPASATLATSPASGEAAAETPSRRPPPDGAAVTLSGKSEAELRDMLGTPTSEEDRPPGKRWRYRDGQCTLDVQLYPDVQTKQFGTLAYEVKSDDNTDEGKRLCLAQIQSRVQARH